MSFRPLLCWLTVILRCVQPYISQLLAYVSELLAHVSDVFAHQSVVQARAVANPRFLASGKHAFLACLSARSVVRARM